MTNRIAIGLGLIVVLFLLIDSIGMDWDMTLFLMRKFAQLIEYLAFWR